MFAGGVEGGTFGGFDRGTNAQAEKQTRKRVTLTGAADGEDGVEEGAVAVEDVEGYWGAVGPINEAKDWGEAAMGEEDAEHVATVERIESVLQVGTGQRVLLREGFEKKRSHFRAAGLQCELVVAQDVYGVAEDFVHGIGGCHFVQRLTNGDGTDAACRLRDGNEGAGKEEVAAPFV